MPSPIDPKKIDETGRMISESRRLLAYGGLDGVIQRPLFDGDGGVFPHFATAAQGCRITDSTGQTMIDWVNGWGPTLLGYRHPAVEKAIINQLQAGPTLSLMNPIEIEVARLISELVPCAEMVAFGKNGSDAVTAAIRIARSVTQRDIVLQYGFHGFHDWYTCLQPGTRGILPVLKEYVDSFEYNDLPGLQQLLEKYQGRVAAVIMEPVNMWLPEPDYLASVKKLAHDHGSLLIFDEIVTVFRVARGGAQELYGVEPDLTCLGKGMANGMPLSAVVGKRNYMEHLKSCAFGMTYRGETLSLAAAKATLEIIRDEPVTQRMNEIGTLVRDGFHDLCSELDIKCQLSGPASRMTFVFHDQHGISWSEARALFLQECLKAGVLTNGNLLASYAHDEEAAQQTLASFRTALNVLKQAQQNHDAAAAMPVGGSMFQVTAQQATGFIDQLRERDDELILSGWILLNSGAADSIQVRSSTGLEVEAEKMQRPDLQKAFPHREGAAGAGFQAVLPKAQFSDQESFRFTLDALAAGHSCFQCLVNFRVGQTLSGPWSISDGVLYL